MCLTSYAVLGLGADPVVAGMVFNCVALLLLISLAVAGYCLSRKHDTIKKAVPVLSAHLDSQSAAS